jgi:hypothetical protein
MLTKGIGRIRVPDDGMTWLYLEFFYLDVEFRLAWVRTSGRENLASRKQNDTPYSQKIRPGRCPDPEIIALRMLMINQAQEVSGRFPASLTYGLIVSPSPAVPSTLIPLPCRSTSAGFPAALDTAQLPCFPLPPTKESKSDGH